MHHTSLLSLSESPRLPVSPSGIMALESLTSSLHASATRQQASIHLQDFGISLSQLVHIPSMARHADTVCSATVCGEDGHTHSPSTSLPRFLIIIFSVAFFFFFFSQQHSYLASVTTEDSEMLRLCTSLCRITKYVRMLLYKYN